MIAGATWQWWIGFHAVVGLLLVADAWRTRRGRVRARDAWGWSVFLIAVAVAFAVWLHQARGPKSGLEFLAGYTIETSLSIDNLFVFLVLFRAMGVEPQRQRTALSWGVGGAVLLRAVFIAAGLALLRHFHWINGVFGVFLLYVALTMLRPRRQQEETPTPVRWLLSHMRGTSLLPVILAVELTDVLFAVDSIPAVLAVSHSPLVVYTSNVAAVLGLRSLYFALAALLDRLRYLHYGLAALLGFVGFKMLAEHWIEIPIVASLAIMGAILAVCGAASWWAERRAG